MRTIAAILCSVLLLLAQGLAALLPFQPAAPTSCCGCRCTQRDCCSTRPASTSERPQPLAAQREAAPALKQAKTPMLVALLPAPSVLREFPAAPAASSPSAVLPLYRQHCALLL